MSDADFPGIGELMPHDGPMRLLSRVLGHSPESTRCELAVAASALFRDDAGGVPAWVALEWMAQCIAAHGGLVALAAGRKPPSGVLVGARSLALTETTFGCSDNLTVSARFLGASGALVSFACEVEEQGRVVVQGVLSVFVVEER